jgi:predicted dehydrogenase
MHRIAIVGFGIQGRRVASNLVRHPAFQIAAVWDPDPAARLAAAGVTTATPDDVGAIFDDKAIATVYIASPPRSHLGYVARALDAGKAVFCEKPLATEAAPARALVERIERTHARAAVNFSLANAPAFLAVRSALAAGEIGRPQRIEINVAFRRWPRKWQADASGWLSRAAEGGFTREVISHFLWATRRIFGPIAVETHAIERPAPDAAETRMSATFTAAAVAGAVSGRVADDAPGDDFNEWIVAGEAGALRIHDWTQLSKGPAEARREHDLGTPEQRREASRDAQLYALAALIDGRPHDLPSFREALDVQLAVEAMLAT